MPRTAGTPQGGVISPLLANLFLHYTFDLWMVQNFRHIPFERYADDVICHCKSAEEARELWRALADRFATCKLVLHPEKTKIVYCKDVNRRGDFPVTVTSIRRNCVPPCEGSMLTSFAGHAVSSSECVIGPKGHETGLTGSAGRTPISSPTGSYAMATAEHREPCESRGSCTVLGAPWG